MRDRVGTVTTQLGVHVHVTLRSRLGHWKASRVETEDEAESHKRAWLLPPEATVVVDCLSGEFDHRRRRLESLTRRSLGISPLPAKRGRRSAILVCRDALRELPEGVCAVPSQVALATWARVLGVRGACGVWWRSGEAQLACHVRRAVPASREVAGGDGFLWLALSHRGSDSREVFGDAPILDAPTHSIDPRSVLAAGVAMSYGAAGTFPPPSPSRTRTLARSVARSTPWLAAGLVCALWLPTERLASQREREVLEQRGELERIRWQMSSSPGSLSTSVFSQP